MMCVGVLILLTCHCRSNLQSQQAIDVQEAGDGLRTPAPETPTPFFSLNELHTKDAYLVFRALCKLGMKPLGVER